MPVAIYSVLIITIASLLGAAPAPDDHVQSNTNLQSVWSITKNRGDITSSKLGINEGDHSYGCIPHVELHRGIINDS